MKRRKRTHLTNSQRTFMEGIYEVRYTSSPYFDDIKEKDHPFNDERIQRICRTLCLFDKLQDVNEVAKQMNLSRRTIYYYLETYAKNPNFMRKRKKIRVSELQNYFGVIREEINNGKVKTYKQAQEIIENLTGIKRGRTQIRAFLNNNYFKKDANGYLKCKYTRTIKRIIDQKNEMANHTFFTEENKNEMEEYAYQIASSCNYNEFTIAKRLKEKFHLNKTDKEMVDWLKKNTSLY